MPRAKAASFLRVALLLAPLSLGLAACETLENLNPFDEQGKKTPLSGDRRSLFPDGVPGVERNAPPQQPSNSNIQIPPQQAPEANPDAQVQQPEPQQTPTRQAKRRGPANTGDDPWAERR